MTTLARAAVGAALALVTAQAGTAQHAGFGLEPAAFWNDGDPLVGVRGTAAFDQDMLSVSSRCPFKLRAREEADLPLVYDDDRNPEMLTAELAFEGFVSLYCPTEEGGLYDRAPNFGHFALDLELAAEAPQRVGFIDGAGGIGFRYGHEEAGWMDLLPSVLDVDYRFIRCFDCELPSDADRDSERLSVEADWYVGVGSFWLRPGLRWFDAGGVGRAARRLRRQEGFWGSVEVAYQLEPRSGWLEPLQEVFVRYTDGDLPLRMADESALSGGITLVW